MGFFRWLIGLPEPVEEEPEPEEIEDEPPIVEKSLKEKLEDKFSEYDFNSIEGISAIPDPPIVPIIGMPDGFTTIEYYLQRKATEHKRNGRIDLAIACLRRSNDIMSKSNIMYTKKDYMRLVEYLRQNREFDESRKIEEEIKEQFYIPPHKQEGPTYNFDGNIVTYDLVHISTINFTCPECAKYQGRVYSLSGKDERFPKLPDFINQRGQLHEDCCHNMTVYVPRSWTDQEEWDKIIKISNRPFINDQTPEQNELYKNWKKEKDQKKIDRQEYDYIWEHLPDCAPKSFGGYRHMKALNSKNFTIIEKRAKEIGLEIIKL